MTDSKKYVVTLAILIGATTMLWVGKITGAEWVSTVTWTAGLFMAGQAAAVVATGYLVQASKKGDAA